MLHACTAHNFNGESAFRPDNSRVWEHAFDQLQDYIFVALCDPVCAELSSRVLRAFIYDRYMMLSCCCIRLVHSCLYRVVSSLLLVLALFSHGFCVLLAPCHYSFIFDSTMGEAIVSNKRFAGSLQLLFPASASQANSLCQDVFVSFCKEIYGSGSGSGCSEGIGRLVTGYSKKYSDRVKQFPILRKLVEYLKRGPGK